MKSRTKRTKSKYTVTSKLPVVSRYEKAIPPISQLRSGIQGKSTVMGWLRKHGILGWSHAASLTAKPIDESSSSLISE